MNLETKAQEIIDMARCEGAEVERARLLGMADLLFEGNIRLNVLHTSATSDTTPEQLKTMMDAVWPKPAPPDNVVPISKTEDTTHDQED